MIPEEVGRTARWINLLVIFKSPEGPKLGLVVKADSCLVSLLDFEGHLCRMTWRAVEMKPVAIAFNHSVKIDTSAINISEILEKNPQWKKEAMTLKKLMQVRWTQK